jgi:hypothetical protein
MGSAAMMRYSAIIPIAVLVGVPLWTAPSLPVILLAAITACLCSAGVVRLWLAATTLGGALALIDYALAALLAGGAFDIIGAAIFGLALLSLLDLVEFERRFRGAEIAIAVYRTQISFWVGRAAAAAAIVLMFLGAAVVAPLIPVLGRPVIAGLGAAIAFVGAMRGGIVQGGSDAS